MKGGKAGRPRRPSKQGTKARPIGGKAGKPLSSSRQASTAPKKGARRKETGGRSSTGEDS